MKKIIITNGRVIDPKNKLDKIVDILIENGKIKKIGKISDSKTEKINAKGLIVAPGFVDMHVHLREPGGEAKETIETGLKSALKGGITSVLAMPNTNPLIDSPVLVKYQLNKAKELNLANLFVSARITKNGCLSDMRQLQLAGAIALTDDGDDVEDAGLLRHAFEWAKTFDLPILVHAEMTSISGNGAMHEGEISSKLGLTGIPRSAEDLAVYKSILLAEEIGAKVHITHVSTFGAVEAIRQAKKRGAKVTAEATPHHFSLTHEECLNWNTNAKMYPPLREEKDIKAVQKGLKDGTIDAIATDHAPHTAMDKLVPFDEATRGTVGLETSFAVGNTYLVRNKALTLNELISKMTYKPAKILGIKKGTLNIGTDADIAIIDPNKKWVVNPDNFESKGKNSAFANKTLYGQIVHTLVNGEIKLKNKKIIQ